MARRGSDRCVVKGSYQFRHLLYLIVHYFFIYAYCLQMSTVYSDVLSNVWCVDCLYFMLVLSSYVWFGVLFMCYITCNKLINKYIYTVNIL